IAGVVGDENDVGLHDHDVVAYRNTRPPQLIARAKTDDRGMYRIWGLEPGVYLVRTLAKKHDEAGYLPTFAKQTDRVEEAYIVDVNLDLQTDNVNVRAVPGRLLSVGGRIVVSGQASQATVTLVSDMG